MVKPNLKLRLIRDKGDKHSTKKDRIFDLPMRLCVVGKTGTGKSSTVVSLLTDPDFYDKDFLGRNIYLFSPMQNDYKMEYLINKKSIPDFNVYTELDDGLLRLLYDKLCEEFKTESIINDKVTNKLIIIDDFSYSGELRKGLFNMVNKVFMNGRKNLISIMVTSQYYTHIAPACRTNASGLILYTMNDKELEKVSDENNYLDNKKQFKQMVKSLCFERHDFFVINYSNKRKEGLYLNSQFEKVN